MKNREKVARAIETVDWQRVGNLVGIRGRPADWDRCSQHRQEHFLALADAALEALGLHERGALEPEIDP